MEKDADAFRTISEVAEDLDLPQHVLRFWETRFTQIKPLKRGGGRRYYRPDDVALVRAIKQLLYGEGYTIKGVQRILKEQGVRAVIAAADSLIAAPRQETGQMAPPLVSSKPELRQSVPTPVLQEAVPTEAKRRSAGGEAFPDAAIDLLRGCLLELEECSRLLLAAQHI